MQHVSFVGDVTALHWASVLDQDGTDHELLLAGAPGDNLLNSVVQRRNELEL
jgi:hypothetical protein